MNTSVSGSPSQMRSSPPPLRTPQAVRVQAIVAYAISGVAGFIASFLMHLLFGGAGRGGFVDLNPGGVLEILAFVLVFSYGLLWTRQLFRLPISTLLSAGLETPPAAKMFAQKLEEFSPSNLEMGQNIAVLREQGKVIGLFDGIRDRNVEWDSVPQAKGNVAVTELRGLLSKHPFVIIADGDTVHGVITQEMFIHGFYRGGISK